MEFAWAVVPPDAAMLIARDYPKFLQELESRGRSLMLAGKVAYGRQVIHTARQIRARGAERLTAMTSEVGRSEVPPAVDASVSERVLRSGLTTRQVAERFGFAGPRQVLNLIRDERLSATWDGATWTIDEVSVAQELERRSQT